ncbi:hypothetical protein ACB094_01G354600 [Castanea mollissima]
MHTLVVPISGTLPMDLGSHIPKLQGLYISDNEFSGKLTSQFNNCTELSVLSLSYNKFDGSIPKGFGSLEMLEFLALGSNNLTGNIPPIISNLSMLLGFVIGKSNVKGGIPNTWISCPNPEILELGSNKISGHIPSHLSNFSSLFEVDFGSNSNGNWFFEKLVLGLSGNSLTRNIPSTLGGLERLQRLFIEENLVEGSIPEQLCQLKNLGELLLSMNSLKIHPKLPWKPYMKKLPTIVFMDLSCNQIIGNIPSIIGAFESLSHLNMSKNSFQGNIPQSYGQLLGEISSTGPFANFTAKSFLDNEALCGNPIFRVPPCTSPTSLGSRVKQVLLKYIVYKGILSDGIIIAVKVLSASIIIFAALVIIRRRHPQCNMQIPGLPITLPTVDHRMISYQELSRFGFVYKGILSDGIIIAVKVLNLQLEGAFKSFDAECKVLSAIQHRNLVKVISTCSNLEFRALMLQYIVNIMVDVALALEYLHSGQSESMVHCDLKPSNIRLDEDMIAHVSDFGIAKILAINKDATQTKTLSTLGYIAPEYGSEGRVSTKGDICSYEVILLEIITRKKPTSEMFVGELTMRKWIASLLDNVMDSVPMEVVDDGLLRIEDGRDVTGMQDILLSILDLGLRCFEESTDERPDIKDVMIKVNKFKLTLRGNINMGV